VRTVFTVQRLSGQRYDASGVASRPSVLFRSFAYIHPHSRLGVFGYLRYLERRWLACLRQGPWFARLGLLYRLRPSARTSDGLGSLSFLAEVPELTGRWSLSNWGGALPVGPLYLFRRGYPRGSRSIRIRGPNTIRAVVLSRQNASGPACNLSSPSLWVPAKGV